MISQEYPHKEIIIIDGGSTDNTIDVIRKYEKYIHYWASEEDNGQSHAINKGLAKATGEVFNWINSDDYLEEGALQHIADAYQQRPETNVVCGFTHCFYEGSGKTSHTYQMGVRKSATDTLLNIEISQPATFYRTEVVRDLGGINESLHFAFDDELWMRYLLRYGQDNILKINQLLAHFRLHPKSKSVTGKYKSFFPDRMAAYTQIAKQLNLPDFLIAKMFSESFTGYKTGEWNIREINIDKFISHFAAKYQYTLYKDFEYEAAKYCMKKTLKYGDWQLNPRYIALFIKLFVINKHFLRLLRNS